MLPLGCYDVSIIMITMMIIMLFVEHHLFKYTHNPVDPDGGRPDRSAGRKIGTGKGGGGETAAPEDQERISNLRPQDGIKAAWRPIWRKVNSVYGGGQRGEIGRRLITSSCSFW